MNILSSKQSNRFFGATSIFKNCRFFVFVTAVFTLYLFLYFSSSLSTYILNYTLRTLQIPCCIPSSCFFCVVLNVPQLSGGGSVPLVRLQTAHKKVNLRFDIIAQYLVSSFTSLMVIKSSSPLRAGGRIGAPPPSPPRPPDAPPSSGRGLSGRAKGPRTGKRWKDFLS